MLGKLIGFQWVYSVLFNVDKYGKVSANLYEKSDSHIKHLNLTLYISHF